MHMFSCFHRYSQLNDELTQAKADLTSSNKKYRSLKEKHQQLLADKAELERKVQQETESAQAESLRYVIEFI